MQQIPHPQSLVELNADFTQVVLRRQKSYTGLGEPIIPPLSGRNIGDEEW